MGLPETLNQLLAMRATMITIACVFAGVAPASADSVVNLCNQDNQIGSGVNLQQALQIGGVISFACGGTATLRITQTHDIPRDVTIMGSDAITLDAQGRQLSMFRLTGDAVRFMLSNVTVQGARLVPANVLSFPARGSVVTSFTSNKSSITLQSVTVLNNEGPVLIENSGVKLTVRNTQFRGNTSYSIFNGGAATIDQCSFISNETGIAAGGDKSATTVSSTIFSQNKANAIDIGPLSSLHLSYSQFQNNIGPSGPALSIDGMAGPVTLRSVDFTGNAATGDGGALVIHPFKPAPLALPPSPPVAVTMSYVTFVQNTAERGGALEADLTDGGSLTIGAGLFDTNKSSAEGGGIFSNLGAVQIAGSIFKANRGAAGSGVFAIARAQEPASIANSLFAANIGGGGAVEGVNLELRNSTLVDNQGGGVHARSGGTGVGMRLVNTILLRNSPANCSGAVAEIAFQAANLQFPADPDCHGGTVQEPLLDPIYAPLPGSPALHGGDLATCMNSPIGGRDLFFQKRGIQGYCAIGALERAPEQFMNWRVWDSQRQSGNGNQNPLVPHL
jgi:hypothetical protein